MAVAVKNAPETAVPRAVNRLAVVSLLGVLYVLGSIGIVFYAVPALWAAIVGDALGRVGFINQSLLLLVMLAAAVGLGFLGARLAGPEMPRGARAGIAGGVAALLLIALVTVGVGHLLESWLGADKAMLGLAVMAVLGISLLFWLVRSYFRSSFESLLVQIEEQGWLTLGPYKKNQGQRVRRGTMLGVLAIAGCGIYTLIQHRTLEFGGHHWVLALPFSGGHGFMLLRDVRFTIPIVLTLASLWFAYRLVNFPAFADFLIATEAELNKVSWASRKRLMQDTIVVLTTVVLLTIFIFLADMVWFTALKWAGVINIPDRPQAERVEVDW